METMKTLEDLTVSLSCAKVGSSESVYATAPSIGLDSLTIAASERTTTSHAAYVTANIELSKCHWSERMEMDCNSTDDEIARDNMEVFQTLQKHPTWRHFFCTFGYDTECGSSSGEMMVGEKFAEGGQAELFHADIAWLESWYNEYCEKVGLEWVLKVFKEGTLLRQLQSQWPQAYLEW